MGFVKPVRICFYDLSTPESPEGTSLALELSPLLHSKFLSNSANYPHPNSPG